MNETQAKEKARELVKAMSLEEKVSQLRYESPAIPRLGLPAYNWWNEALHGVARAGLSTVFPQSIGLAATFDPAILEKVGAVTGQEGRLKNEIYRAEGNRGIYKGLTFWSPNINIVRDPRWGRAHETYGEDPFLTATMGTAFVKGMQTVPEKLQKEDGPSLQAAACVKHLAVHSGPEETRHGFDAEVSEADMRETYLPAFERVVKDAKVAGVMGAYNAINGVPCCANSWLQQEVLRKEWGFTGYTVSDCGAVADISERHHFTATRVEAAAAAVQNGCDLNCGSMYGYLLEAVQKGYLKEEAIDQAAERLLTIRLQLDMDAPKTVEEGQAALNAWLNLQPLWGKLNRCTAEKSMVLLKNEGEILPLKNPKSVAVIGPNARSQTALEGNYHGTAGNMTTILAGLQKALPDAQFLISEGCHLYKNKLEAMSAVPDDQVAEAAAFARYAEVTVLCLGLDPTIEGELGDASNEYAAGDKHSLKLPESQQRLLKAVCEVSDQVVVVLLSGGALDLGEENDKVKGVLQAWYPGAEGGDAVAAVLTGKVNPTGRLPVTFYYDGQVDWDFEDYAMEGKTYRFFQGSPLYPFGFGLSYRKLSLSNPVKTEAGVKVTAYNPHTEKTGMPIQVYARLEEPGLRTPQFQLAALTYVELSPGEERSVEISLNPYWLEVIDKETAKRRACRGRITLFVGDHQPDARSTELTGEECLSLDYVEYSDVYGPDRKPTGRLITRDEKVNPGEKMLAVGIWVFNNQGEILITQRSPEKRFAPGLWENTGGHVMAGENSADAVIRELAEETGIHIGKEDVFLIGQTETPTYYGDEYMACCNVPIEQVRLQPGETSDARWVSTEQLDHMIQTGEIAPSVAAHLAPNRAAFDRVLENVKGKENAKADN